MVHSVRVFFNYTAISGKVVGKKSIKVHATRPKGGMDIHWNFAYWPSLYFCTWKICFSSPGPISLALFLLSHLFE